MYLFVLHNEVRNVGIKVLKKFLYHELIEINVQEVESKSETNFPYLVQAQVGLRE